MVIFRTHVLSTAYSPEPWNPKSWKSTTQDEQKLTELGLDRARVVCLGGGLEERGTAGYATQSFYCFPSTWLGGHGTVLIPTWMGRGTFVVGWPHPTH